MANRSTYLGSFAAVIAGAAMFGGCGSGADAPLRTGGITASGAIGASSGFTSTSGSSGPSSGAAAGTSAGAGTVGSGSSGGAASGSGAGGAGTMGVGSVTLEGSLAFRPDFQGEFYGTLPDGGADLTNLDCRIANGFDLWQACDSTVLTPAIPDGGGIPSSEILDIYVTSLDNSPLFTGDAKVVQGISVDGGVYAAVQVTTLGLGGSPDVLVAVSGDVSYEASVQGMSGTFNAVFVLPDGGGATLSGTFGASYCSSLNGY